MKNNFKTYAKKSVSLFLAVLMVMSCWVWMAPEEAEAGNITILQEYKVRVFYRTEDRKGSFDGGHIKYKTCGENGWGSESGETIGINSLKLDNNITNEVEFTANGFPTNILVTTSGGNTGWGDLTQDANKARIVVTKITINGKTVWTGEEGHNGANTLNFYPTYDVGGNLGTTGSTGGTYTWGRPHIVGFLDSTGVADSIEIDLNKVNGNNAKGSTVYDFKDYTLYDQYGVAASDFIINNDKYCPTKSVTTYVADTNNNDSTTEFENDIWASETEDATVVVSPNLQLTNPQTSGRDTFYLVRKYELDDCFGGTATSKASAPIIVKYPTYPVNFHPGLDSAELSDSSGKLAISEETGAWSPELHHSGTIRVPTKATAAGYTFYGFWENKQPGTGDASYNAKEADYAMPCSTDDYNGYKKAVGSTVEGNIVIDAEGNRWYDAGSELDPSIHKTIDVSNDVNKDKDGNLIKEDDMITDWYGWWLADDVTVKFYDVDGTYIGTQTVKNGQDQNAITWPKSKYINEGYTTGDYVSGSFTFKVDGNVWVNTNGDEVLKNGHTFSSSTTYILTPKLTKESFTNNYKVSFKNTTGAEIVVGTEGGNYVYRQNIGERASEAYTKLPATPVRNDMAYTYELLGWSSVVPYTGKSYHVLLENADLDENRNPIGINDDWIVRGNATYYAVYRRHAKTYAVNFNYTDATGAPATELVTVKYGTNLVPPTSVVPSKYVVDGYGYAFKGWSYFDGTGTPQTLGYKEACTFNSENFDILESALFDPEDPEAAVPVEIDATYESGVPTDYLITFSYVDANGEADAILVYVKNKEYITSTTVSQLKPATTWDYEDQLYTYADKWEITEGAVKTRNGETKTVGAKIETKDLVNLSPTSNVNLKAVYADPVPFCTVTYVDGTNTWSDRVLKDSAVPAWFVDGKEYKPADYKGEGGTFVFAGWFDQAQLDADRIETNGKQYTTADTVTSDLTLYAQFKFEPDKFLIEFWNHDHSVQLGGGNYVKGQNIEEMVSRATRAARARDMDETYEYTFIGWDKPVPTECEGRAMSFTALYKREYRYYDAKWYNSVLEDGNWVADKTTDAEGVETKLLATTHHTYNSKINLPSVKVVCQETPDDSTQSYVFAGWNYVIRDKDGNVTESGKYERGMKITSEMEFFATFTLSPKTFTVTTIVKGETETYTAATGSKITDIISDPKAGYVAPVYVEAENGNYDLVDGKYVKVEDGTGSYNLEKASCHDAFAGWYTDNNFSTKVADDAVITSDMTLYAKFEESDHKYTESKTTKAPTYYEKGEKTEWCVCNAEETSRTAEIPMLTDSVAPTGTIYLGGLGSWSSTDAIGGAALDKDEDGNDKEITLYANANTDVIITANDTGDVDDEFNPSGLGKGVKYIRAFVYPGKFKTLTSTSYGAAQSLARDVYVDETQAQNNNANFSVKLGDFVVAEFDENGDVVMENGKVKSTALKSGESYIVYYYVVDKAGKQLNSKVRTAKFWYDAVAPEFDIEGTSDKAYIPTYCGTATVTGFEEEVTLTVNNKAATLTDGKLVISAADYKDNVVITATDKAGNTYSKKIKVADHKWDVETVAATCTEDGYTQAECIICKATKDREPILATGHGTVDAGTAEWVVTKEADCNNDGSEELKCLKCKATIDTKVIVSEGHKFAVDTEGNTIYKVITKSTCNTAGKKEARCTVCNGDLEGGLDARDLPLDNSNHEKITVDEEAADCTHDGWYKETCICGDVLVDKNATTDPDTYKATGHGTLDGGDAMWYTETPATCYTDGSKILQCSKCSSYIGEYVVIPATGEHVKVVSNPDSYKTDKEIRYQCATPGCPEVYEPTPYVDQTLKNFTVIFKAENGTELSKTTVAEGSYVSDDGITAPGKEATESVRYTFAGWVANGKVAKFPYAVTEDVTFTASYKETTIKYKHIFQVPTTITKAEDGKLVYGGERNCETLIGTYGQETKYSGKPELKLAASAADYNKLYTFEFKGWKDTDGNKVTDFTVKGNATFVAYYEETAIIHKVSFYNGTNLLKQVTDVVAGTTGIVYTGETPVKNFDNEYHYTFNGWYTDSTCKTPYDPDEGIVSDLQIYAGFTKTKHGNYAVALDENGEEIITKKASCGVNEEKQFKCGNCGHTKVEVIANSALEHDWSGTPEYDESTGNNVITCKNGCGETKKEKIAVKVTFKNYNKTALSTVEYKIGEEISYTGATPERAEDDAKTYTFAGWKLENDTSDKIYHNGEFGVITADSLDMVFIACYTETAKMYKVSYLPANSEVALYIVEVKYGSTLPEYIGSTDRQAIFGSDYRNQYDDNGHYVFEKWNKDASYIVKGDTEVRPVIKVDTENGHSWKFDTVEPTCTEDGGKIKMCEHCAYRDVESDRVPALNHKYNEGVITTAPDYQTQTPGIMTYTCTRCGDTYTKEIAGTSYSIKATVKDANGNPSANVRVELLKKNEAGVYELHMAKNTGADGVVIFAPLTKGDYRVFVTSTNTHYDATVKEDGTVSGGDITAQPENKPVDNSCKCSCHKDNFWGIIYRLIQKIIKFFTGKPSCCACPDEDI